MAAHSRRHSGADELRAAVAALDELAAAAAARHAADTRLRAALLAAKETPRVTVEEIAHVLGTTRRNIYKMLAR